MKKQLAILALTLCFQTHSVGKIIIGSAAFLNKVGRDCPQFGRVDDKQAQIFSTAFIYPITNPEIIKPYLPEAINELIHKHSHAHVTYKIRISTSVNNKKNIKNEFEAIPMPWSVLFHGWAYQTPIMQYKTVEWGFYDPISFKKELLGQNFVGFDESFGKSSKKKVGSDKNPIKRNTLHKEQILIEHDGPTYKKALPINQKRNFLNFWTFGYIHDASINRNEIIVIYELVIKEPSFKTRKNKTTQGVFYPDLAEEKSADDAEFDTIYNRLQDYLKVLKQKSYKLEKPLSTDLQESLKKIRSGRYHLEDQNALENFATTMKDIYELIKFNPLTEDIIQQLAQTYSEEFQKGKTEKEIKLSIQKIVPQATDEQRERIFAFAKNIHAGNLHNVSSHILNLEKNKGYLDQQLNTHEGLYTSIHPMYQSYAERMHKQKIGGHQLLDTTLKNKKEFDKKLQEALIKISDLAHESKNDTEFLEKLEHTRFDQKIAYDETFQKSIFLHRKKFAEKDIENIYETIQFSLENSTDDEKISGLKSLINKVIHLHETVSNMNSLKDEDALFNLMNTQLKEITNTYNALIE